MGAKWCRHLAPCVHAPPPAPVPAAAAAPVPRARTPRRQEQEAMEVDAEADAGTADIMVDVMEHGAVVGRGRLETKKELLHGNPVGSGFTVVQFAEPGTNKPSKYPSGHPRAGEAIAADEQYVMWPCGQWRGI